MFVSTYMNSWLKIHGGWLRLNEMDVSLGRRLRLHIYVLAGLVLAFLNHDLTFQPLFLTALCVEQALTHTDSRITLYVLLGASLMFISHVHDSSGFTAVHFIAEEAAELLMDLTSRPSDSPLLTGTILAGRASRLTLQPISATYKLGSLRLNVAVSLW